MEKYIGTKIIHAEPCPAWKQSGDWVIGADGYKVTYEDGYESWSPKKAFEDAYRPVTGLSFGLAVEAMKKGFKVSRSGWNGKSMWLFFVDSSEYQIDGHNLPVDMRFGQMNVLQPFICMKTAQDLYVPWLASQSDMLSDDWSIVG